MNVKKKPKYNMVQNIAWMIHLAWRVRKRVLLFCVLSALVEVLYHLTQLYIAPEILQLVENHASLGELLLTILLFTAALFITLGLKEYLSSCAPHPQIDVRAAIIGMVTKKANTTSFVNTVDAAYIKLREKAHNN